MIAYARGQDTATLPQERCNAYLEWCKAARMDLASLINDSAPAKEKQRAMLEQWQKVTEDERKEWQAKAKAVNQSIMKRATPKMASARVEKKQFGL